ncbi:hypothetical protein ACGFYZ_33010 [Streptomyces sp. NPDC048330]|uniref:hypothetical protein n=1 Tax=Streptomyces sp. NPDC048330 TaxID=3365533 RepID=UPI00371FE448
MDSESVMARLRAAGAEDSRDRDRLCERAAKVYLDEKLEPPFTVRSADFATDAFLICADRYWRLRFLAEPSVRTAAACAVWLTSHVEAEHRQAVEEKLALGFGFITRDTVDTDAALTQAAAQVAQLGTGASDVAFFVAVYHAGKLRGNFWFDALYDFTSWHRLVELAGERATDPVLTALKAFGALGSRRITTEHALGLVHDAWSSPRRSRAVTDVCLNGLSAASPFDTQGTELRDRAKEAVAVLPDDHGMWYWLAYGQHLCAEHEAACVSIDKALALLPAVGGRGSHELLQEQYRRRRDMIQDGRRHAEMLAARERRWGQRYPELPEHPSTAQLADEPTREANHAPLAWGAAVSATFVAVIAAASRSVALGDMTLGERLGAVSALWGISAGTVVLVLVVLGLLRRRRDVPR